MKKNIYFASIIIFLISVSVQAQYKNEITLNKNKKELTGNFQLDARNYINQENNIEQSNKNVYSPLRAGLYSVLIPGAGQLYTKSYWQSAAFFGAEVVSWILYISYTKKGDEQNDLFQKYADENWSVVKYVRWIELNYHYPSTDMYIGSPAFDISKPWQYVNWEKLNYYEEEIGKKQHSGFSHKLAPYGDQQYYEMIGKYPQFIGGWNDAWDGTNSLYNTTDVYNEKVSANFLKYRDMRGEANNFYNIATTVSYIIVANHIFSALEAAWNASKINRSIQLEGHILPRSIYGNFVEYVPTLKAKYEF